MHFSEALIPIFMFAALFGVFYLYITARHKERMSLIEKGADASLFYASKNKPIRGVFSMWTLKLALFLIGVGFGVLVGNILAVTTGLEEAVCYLTSILVFGGSGLLVYYLYEKNMLREYED
jgi:hypothetical protein